MTMKKTGRQGYICCLICPISSQPVFQNIHWDIISLEHSPVKRLFHMQNQNPPFDYASKAN